jgi:hypothetical protein
MFLSDFKLSEAKISNKALKQKRWVPEYENGDLLNDIAYTLVAPEPNLSRAETFMLAVQIWIEDHSRYPHNKKAWNALNEHISAWHETDPDEFERALDIPTKEMDEIKHTFSSNESDYSRFIEIHLIFRGLRCEVLSNIPEMRRLTYGQRVAEAAFSAFIKGGALSLDVAFEAMIERDTRLTKYSSQAQFKILLDHVIRLAERESRACWSTFRAETDNPEMHVRKMINMLWAYAPRLHDWSNYDLLPHYDTMEESEAFYKWFPESYFNEIHQRMHSKDVACVGNVYL